MFEHPNTPLQHVPDYIDLITQFDFVSPKKLVRHIIALNLTIFFFFFLLPKFLNSQCVQEYLLQIPDLHYITQVVFTAVRI